MAPRAATRDKRRRIGSSVVGLSLFIVALLPQPELSAGTARAARASVSLPDRARDAAMMLAAKNPFAEIEKPQPGSERFDGRVSELMLAGSYTYLLVDCDDGTSRWVVTMSRGLELDDEVTIKNMGTKRDFHSTRLDRSFGELLFAIVRPRASVGGSR